MRYGVGASGRAQAPGRASLELGLDGGLKLLTGAVDLGQGSDTALSIIAASDLSQPVSSISIVTGDTEITPDAGPSTGSRLVYYVGNAAKDSAMQLKEAVLSTASDLLETPLDELQLEEGRVTSTNGNGKSALFATLAQVAQARHSAGQPLRFDGVFEPHVAHI